MGSNSEDLAGRTRADSGSVSHEADAEVTYFIHFLKPCSEVAPCRVTSSIFSADARFVLSGSDDGNVRIWKAKASDKLGVITARERAAIEYRNSLKERWRVDSEVDRVARFVVSLIPGHQGTILMI